MIPMLIGTAERQLFAVYSASSGKRQRRAVVLCAPFGDEYGHTHRTGRLLAQRLSALGAEVLRFDYYGTGDSGGQDEEFGISGAVADTIAAVAEARQIGGVRHVTLIGLRGGAAPALLAAAVAPGVDRLVLWDPVLDGIDPAALPEDTLLVVSRDSPGHQALRERLRALSPRVAFAEVPGALPWEPVGDDGIGIAPLDMLGRIESWAP